MSEKPAPPPVAPRFRRSIELHGVTLSDDYFWMRDKPSLEVRRHLEAENAHALESMKDTAALQEALYAEIVGRIKETDAGVPWEKDGFWYHVRTEAGKQYPIHCRRRGSPEAPEEVFLDVNELAKGERFMSVGTWRVSGDGTLLAFTTDRTGFRDYTLHVRDLASGRELREPVERVDSVAWAADGRTLFYTITDAAKRPYRLYRHALGSPRDVLVHEETDERFGVEVSRTRSRRFLLLTIASHTQSEVRFWSAGEPDAVPRIVAPREPEHEYDVDHRGDLFYVRTNKGCRNFRVMTAPVSDPGPGSWKELVPCRADVMIEDLDVFADHLVLSEREGAIPRVAVMDLRTGTTRRVEWDEALHSVEGAQNAEFQARFFRVEYESFTTPPSVYDIDLGTLEKTLRKRTEVPGGYDPAAYRSERVWAKAGDGTRVPVSVVYRAGLTRDRMNPALLVGYGAYGHSLSPVFRASLPSLLDRGFVYAEAHIRGGGDLGKRWHDEGRMLAKRNTFTDFIAAAEKLLEAGWTSKERLGILGGSAGGLLVGAVANMRPDLFGCVVALVPFVDVVNTMLDESLPLTVGEFEEWGNPAKKEEFDYIRSYSPYDNLEAKAYPPMLVRTSFDDSQVMYWEPAKYVAKLRTLKTDANPLLFFTNMAGGHGGASGRYDKIRETAFDYAFLLKVLKPN